MVTPIIFMAHTLCLWQWHTLIKIHNQVFWHAGPRNEHDRTSINPTFLAYKCLVAHCQQERPDLLEVSPTLIKHLFLQSSLSGCCECSILSCHHKVCCDVWPILCFHMWPYCTIWSTCNSYRRQASQICTCCMYTTSAVHSTPTLVVWWPGSTPRFLITWSFLSLPSHDFIFAIKRCPAIVDLHKLSSSEHPCGMLKRKEIS